MLHFGKVQNIEGVTVYGDDEVEGEMNISG
jgi:hypothetical protein